MDSEIAPGMRRSARKSTLVSHQQTQRLWVATSMVPGANQESLIPQRPLPQHRTVVPVSLCPLKVIAWRVMLVTVALLLQFNLHLVLPWDNLPYHSCCQVLGTTCPCLRLEALPVAHPCCHHRLSTHLPLVGTSTDQLEEWIFPSLRVTCRTILCRVRPSHINARIITTMHKLTTRMTWFVLSKNLLFPQHCILHECRKTMWNLIKHWTPADSTRLELLVLVI